MQHRNTRSAQLSFFVIAVSTAVGPLARADEVSVIGQSTPDDGWASAASAEHQMCTADDQQVRGSELMSFPEGVQDEPECLQCRIDAYATASNTSFTLVLDIAALPNQASTLFVELYGTDGSHSDEFTLPCDQTEPFSLQGELPVGIGVLYKCRALAQMGTTGFMWVPCMTSYDM